jgi:hypothetical protein
MKENAVKCGEGEGEVEHLLNEYQIYTVTYLLGGPGGWRPAEK